MPENDTPSTHIEARGRALMERDAEKILAGITATGIAAENEALVADKPELAAQRNHLLYEMAVVVRTAVLLASKSSISDSLLYEQYGHIVRMLRAGGSLKDIPLQALKLNNDTACSPDRGDPNWSPNATFMHGFTGLTTLYRLAGAQGDINQRIVKDLGAIQKSVVAKLQGKLHPGCFIVSSEAEKSRLAM